MKKIGIIGGGITGLTCAYKLQNDYEVTLIEKDSGFGGHAQTAVVDGISMEHGVAVFAEEIYPDFFKLMREIGFNDFNPYGLSGLYAHDREKTHYYLDINLRRLASLMPKYIKDRPFGILNTAQLLPFFNRLISDFKKGELEGVLVMDAYSKYPAYKTLITTVLIPLSLITSVQAKNTTIEHVLNFAFDYKNQGLDSNLIVQLLKVIKSVTAPVGGVGAYMKQLREVTDAQFVKNSEVLSVCRNADKTVTVNTKKDGEQIFDSLIIAAQPFQVASFLQYKNPEEQARFERLSELTTQTLVTNHNDHGILPNVKSLEGFVDYRMDCLENTSQTTIVREGHLYTAQNVPENFKPKPFKSDDFKPGTKGTGSFTDTGITNDNYSINENEILSQHLHAVQHMTPETARLFDKILASNGDDNVYFACAALSNMPTSQEGGVRAALSVVKQLQKNKQG